ncbi:MAG: hypothetical protein BGO12_00190 [Verrucomicrobia bacterium 61-8]|nr:hypothetical protein [Verrucomicrobiota bacterium]OJU97966.1 MAG: hypothetical protein BGO12_00190 [Verrucomicrobia bacterium 61-8]
MKKTVIITASAAALAAPHAHAVLGVGDVVSDPIVEQATVQKNIFDQLKYAWEQTQWAEQLTNLSNTLTTVRQQLETANQVKQAIGDPAAAVGLIDNGLFSGYLQSSGITDTLSDLAGIVQQGAQLSGTIQELFRPINLNGWKNLGTTFDGIASFRDPSDPLKQYRAVENAYSRFQELLLQAQSKRVTLKGQIAQLNTQLKGAQTDAEVQKLVGSLATAQTALGDLDSMVETAHGQVESLHTLNQNRKEEEEVAAEEISRQRNQESAQIAAQAEADMPDLTLPNNDLPPGF